VREDTAPEDPFLDEPEAIQDRPGGDVPRRHERLDPEESAVEEEVGDEGPVGVRPEPLAPFGRLEDRGRDPGDAGVEVDLVDAGQADAASGAILDDETGEVLREEPVLLEPAAKALGLADEEGLELAERRRFAAGGDEPVEVVGPGGAKADGGPREHYILSGIGTPRTPRTSSSVDCTSWIAARRALRLSSLSAWRIGCVW
jgi:hypothetical protein